MRREANLFNRGSHAAALPSAKTRALTVCGRSERLLDIGYFPVRIKVTAHSSDSDQVPTVRQAPLWALERVCGRTVSVLQGPHSNRRSQTLGDTERSSQFCSVRSRVRSQQGRNQCAGGGAGVAAGPIKGLRESGGPRAGTSVTTCNPRLFQMSRGQLELFTSTLVSLNPSPGAPVESKLTG